MNTAKLILFVLAMIISFPALAANDQVSLPQLLERIEAKDDANQLALRSLQYHEKLVVEQIGAANQVSKKQEAEMIIRPGNSPEIEVLSTSGDDLPSDPDEAASQAKGQEEQRKRTNISFREISSRFSLTFLGHTDVLGESAYLIGFQPKPLQPYNNQTERVLNHLKGKLWVRASDATVLKTEATLSEPVEVAWIFATISRLDFSYELLKDANGIGPCKIKTFVRVDAPLLTIQQNILVDMDKFQLRQPLKSPLVNPK